MPIALVTGATGFIGGYAVEVLIERGWQVHGLSRHAGASDATTWHAADLFDPVAVQHVLEVVRPTHLIHAAWDTTHGRYWTSPDNLHWVEATLRLARLFHRAGGRRFVGVGTCAEYPWGEGALGDQPIREDATLGSPTHFYGVAKRAAGDLLQAYGQSVGLEVAWGRVFFPYGPRERRPTLIPSVIGALRAGRPALCTHGRQQRDFVHVRDVGEALAALLESSVTGPVNVGSGAATAIGDVVQHLGALLGRPDLVRLGALEPRPGEPGSLVADIGRLRNQVGFSPKIGWPEGLRETVDWWSQASS